MSEYDWETGRYARRTKPEHPGLYQPRARQVDEFVALEHPREHVGWLLHQHAQGKAGPESPRGANAERPAVRRISLAPPEARD